MINPSPVHMESERWQRELAEAVTDPRELLALLDLDPSHLPELDLGAQPFALRVPRYFVGLMQRGDPRDPLLAQVLPLRHERHPAAGFVTDPVGDLAATQDHGVLHKYRGRALMITTGACAVHCRYCFRRHFPYTEQTSLRDWRRAVETLNGLDGVDEVILSGGDPLCISDDRLAPLIETLQGQPQLRRLRIHTRVPVVLPARVTDRLAELLGTGRLQTVVVIHANHPREITPTLGEALRRLADARITLLNQSVLLKFVNDDADTLASLSESLFGAGVMPYYLHLLDPVAGAAHFDVARGHAIRLHDELRARLPGYLVPRLVREVPGAPSKSPL